MNFYPLLVTDIRKDTREAVVVTLEPARQDAEHFNYSPGQYLTFKKTFEGEELRRSYSICSSANDNQLRIGVKKVDGCLLYTSPSPRDRQKSRMPSSA